MKEVTVFAYLFEELSPEAKDKALDLNREIDVPDDLTDFDEWPFEYAKEKGFKDIEIVEYDIWNRICKIKFDEVDWDIILSDFSIKHKKWIIQILKEYSEIKQNYYRDSYSTFLSYNWGSKDHPLIEKQLDFINKILKLKITDLEGDILIHLIEQYDFYTSNSNVAEILSSNGYYFTSTGEIFRVEPKDVLVEIESEEYEEESTNDNSNNPIIK